MSCFHVLLVLSAQRCANMAVPQLYLLRLQCQFCTIITFFCFVQFADLLFGLYTALFGYWFAAHELAFFIQNKVCLWLLGNAGGTHVDPVAMTPQELAKRCGLVFQFPERYFLGGTLQDVSTFPAHLVSNTLLALPRSPCRRCYSVLCSAVACTCNIQ